MSAELVRGLRAIELLSLAPRGHTFTEIAAELETAKATTHRLLAELTRMGYVRLDDVDRYHLTLKSASHALQHLERIPVVELARPLLERLAAATGELARLNLVDDPDLVRVAKAQGRHNGLRYDPRARGQSPAALLRERLRPAQRPVRRGGDRPAASRGVCRPRRVRVRCAPQRRPGTGGSCRPPGTMATSTWPTSTRMGSPRLPIPSGPSTTIRSSEY